MFSLSSVPHVVLFLLYIYSITMQVVQGKVAKLDLQAIYWLDIVKWQQYLRVQLD